jgi:hypothetical protein
MINEEYWYEIARKLKMAHIVIDVAKQTSHASDG